LALAGRRLAAKQKRSAIKINSKMSKRRAAALRSGTFPFAPPRRWAASRVSQAAVVHSLGPPDQAAALASALGSASGRDRLRLGSALTSEPAVPPADHGPRSPRTAVEH